MPTARICADSKVLGGRDPAMPTGLLSSASQTTCGVGSSGGCFILMMGQVNYGWM
jgi:hypothetical protein